MNSSWSAFAAACLVLEAGPFPQQLFRGRTGAGVPVVCIESLNAKLFPLASHIKDERNDTRGIAHMVRVNLYRALRVKSCQSRQLPILLTMRNFSS